MIELDPIIDTGPARVAAIVERSLASGARPAPWFCGAKHPLAVLVRHNGCTQGFDAAGAQIASDELERRYPGQLARFERLARAPQNRATILLAEGVSAYRQKADMSEVPRHLR